MLKRVRANNSQRASMKVNRFLFRTSNQAQERASKELPGPGQHFAFGALKPWEEIHDLLDSRPGEICVGTRCVGAGVTKRWEQIRNPPRYTFC